MSNDDTVSSMSNPDYPWASNYDNKWAPSGSIANPVGQSWAYPNFNSYRSMGRDNLEHGYIFRVQQSSGTDGPPNSIQYNAGKKFQFNPASIQLYVGTVEVDGPDTEADGSNAPGVAFGNSTVGFTMIFDRSIETARATNGKGGPSLAVYKDVGVAKDVFDVYEVITGKMAEGMGADGEGFAGPAISNRPRSIRDMNKSFFDMSAVGLELRMSPLALVLNTNMAFYGHLLNFSVNFLKFNANLVPLTVNLSMTMQIASANSVQGIRDTHGRFEGFYTDPSAPGSSSSPGKQWGSPGPDPSKTDPPPHRQPVGVLPGIRQPGQVAI